MSEETAAKNRSDGSEQLQKLIDEGLMDDFLRETFLDNHLDSLAALAAQTPERIVEALEAHKVELEPATKLVARANELLTDEQKAERDMIVERRLQVEREQAEEAARAIAAAEAEAAAANQTAGIPMGPDSPVNGQASNA
jgi:hypothetical protein